MSRSIALILTGLVAFSAIFSACKTKKTCAAYHSHFLLFPEIQDQYFSAFGPDSVPKEVTTKKLWNGISVGPDSKRSYKKKHYVIPMKDVYRPEVDSGGGYGTSAINIDSGKTKRKFRN